MFPLYFTWICQRRIYPPLRQTDRQRGLLPLVPQEIKTHWGKVHLRWICALRLTARRRWRQVAPPQVLRPEPAAPPLPPSRLDVGGRKTLRRTISDQECIPPEEDACPRAAADGCAGCSALCGVAVTALCAWGSAPPADSAAIADRGSGAAPSPGGAAAALRTRSRRPS